MWIVAGVAVILLGIILSPFVIMSRQTTGITASSSGEAGMMGFPSKSADFELVMDYSDSLAVEERAMMYPPESPTAGETAAEVDQKIIKTGYIDMEVSDVAETVSQVTALATGKGGFIQSSEVQERGDGTHFGSVTARVPSAEFEASMTAIKEFATVVQTESSSGQDVTEQYTDMQAQLRNAEAQEAELLALLTRAEDVEDVLAVQRELFGVRSTIESLQGRIKYLENVTTYSTISVSLSEEPTLRVPSKDFRPLDTIREASQALIALAQRGIEGLIYLLIIGGGILIPLGLIIWGIAKLIQRRK